MKQTKSNTTNTKNNTNVAKPVRKAKTASVLTRDIHKQHLTCTECGGRNGLHRLNQPCDFCGFMLRVQLYPDFANYVKGLSVTKSGRDTLDIADATADSLRGLGEAEVIEVTAKALAQLPIETGLSVKLGRQFKAAGFAWTEEGITNWLDARYEGRNPGMVRMNCGNVLRAASKRSTDEVNA